MRKNNRMFRYCSTRASAIALALASAPLALACSSDYAIGELADEGYPLDNQEPEVAAGGDSILSPLLAPPDVSIPADGFLPGTPASIGDLDGDGFDDFAVVSITGASGSIFSSIHIRYGGPRPQGPVEASILAEGGARLILDTSVATAQLMVSVGDVNADGYEDFMAQMSAVCGAVQQAFLIYGSAERLQGAQRLDAVGQRFSGVTPVAPRVGGCGTTSTQVAGTGDFDGDGFDDFILTESPLYGREDSGTAVSYLFYGREQSFAADTLLESADAIIRSERVSVDVNPTGDVNGDGLADLILGRKATAQRTAFWLPGRAERLSGGLDLAAAATELEGMGASGAYYMPSGPGDLDGDGLNDVLLKDANDAVRLFYGAPSLFANGVQLSDAAATLGTDSEFRVYPGATGDRDGDGDHELFAVFSSTNATDVALLGGSAERLDGDVAFGFQSVSTQRPDGLYLDHPRRNLTEILPAGDLDGDGAADLFSTSSVHETDGTRVFSPELHIHYGTLSAASTPEPR